MNEERASVGVVVVSHNSAHVLGKCLARLSSDPSVEVVVADNASRDDSVEIARSFGARVVSLGRNAGYPTACNEGVRALHRSNQWLAFVNPDVFINGSDLVKAAGEAPSELGAISPLMLDHVGRPQRDIARPKTSVKGMLARYLLSARMEFSARRTYRCLLKCKDRYFVTAVTSGGCLLIRRWLFDELDGWRDTYFLNGDDIDLSYRIGALGGSIAVDRHISASHEKATSSAEVSSIGRLLECARAEVQFFEYHKPVIHTSVVAAAVVGGCLLRVLVRGLKAGGWADTRESLGKVRVLAGEVVRSVQRARRGIPDTGPARALFI